MAQFTLEVYFLVLAQCDGIGAIKGPPYSDGIGGLYRWCLLLLVLYAFTRLVHVIFRVDARLALVCLFFFFIRCVLVIHP